MERKIVFPILLILASCTSALYAQDDNSPVIDSCAIQATVFSEKKSNKICNLWYKVFRHKCPLCKEDKSANTELSDMDNRQAIEKRIQSLNDSIERLNKTIIQLQKRQQALLRQHPAISKYKEDSLQREIQRRDKAITDQIVTTFGRHVIRNSASNYFCFTVMEYPLFYNYDKLRIERSLYTAKTMGYDNASNKDFYWIYNIYYDLLLNYESYNKELINNINAIIDQFEYGKPNREFECERFEDRLKESEYYKVRGKGEYGTYRHIFYLDFQIEEVRKLFKSNADFKKAKFVEIRDAL